MAQAGATKGSPTLLSNVFTSISIILSKDDGSPGGLRCVLLLSCLTGSSELVLLKLALPIEVTELALRLSALLAQSLCFLCFLVAA